MLLQFWCIDCRCWMQGAYSRFRCQQHQALMWVFSKTSLKTWFTACSRWPGPAFQCESSSFYWPSSG
jgi:hypothetical protein